jgi:hypothetical protein
MVRERDRERYIKALTLLPNGCAIFGKGTIFWLRDKYIPNRHAAWQLFHGRRPLPPGARLRATCGQAGCVYHLERVQKPRQKHRSVRPSLADTLRAMIAVGHDGCIEWRRSRLVTYGGRKDTAARVAYLMSHPGTVIQNGHEVRRTCMNYRCVAPWHLEITPAGRRNEIQPYERCRFPSEVEKAYMAGFFDGDGCLDVVAPPGKNGWSLRVRLGQVRVNGPVLFSETYGNPVRISTTGAKGASTVYTWELAKKLGVRALLEDIAPFVREKREQVRIGLALLADDRVHSMRNDVSADLAILAKLRHRRNDPMIAKRFRVVAVTPPAKRGPFRGIWRPPSETTILERAYLAGFFDAEGNVQPKVIRALNWSIEIRFGQVCPEVPELLAARYGGAVRRTPPRGRRSAQFSYVLTIRQAVRRFLLDLAPYVREKAAQVTLALECLSEENVGSRYSKVRRQLERIRELNPKARRPKGGEGRSYGPATPRSSMSSRIQRVMSAASRGQQ